MDDFSFPQVANNKSVKLTITPSLWRISFLVFPEYNQYKEEDNDTNRMHNLQIKSLGSGAKEKMDTLWEDTNDYDFYSEGLVINQAVVQSSRTYHQESLKKSKINAVVIKVTKKLFSLESWLVLRSTNFVAWFDRTLPHCIISEICRLCLICFTRALLVKSKGCAFEF